MICKTCQATSAPGARFCAQCGQKLGTACSRCGHESAAGSVLCEGCGAPTAAATGDRRVVTVLFTDVSGFTSMSEKLPPETVTDIVNRFFTVLTRPIYRYGGVVDKYIGDAIMALFGAPVAHEDDPERALLAAWEMQEAAREFADRLEAERGIRLRVRVGLHTGLVYAGAVGGELKRDYSVLGEAVNVAGKMEQHARPGAILVSEETYRLTNSSWDFEELAPVKVPGRERAVRVFEPQGPRSGTLAFGEERPAFVGREAELTQLGWALRAVREGSPQLAVVSGDAGVGKSRLVRHFLSELTGAWRLIRGRCLGYQRGVTFALLASLVMDWLGATESELTSAWLYDWCHAHASDPERDAELLGYVLGWDVKDPELVRLAPEVLRDLAMLRVQELMLAQDSPPTVLTINDLQWADDASRLWLERLLLAITNPPGPLRLMVLVQHRQDGTTLAPPPGLATLTLPLDPLPTTEGDKLARSFLELEGPPSDELRPVLAQVLARAEGNPLFVCELLRALVDAGAIARTGGAWGVSQSRMPMTLPSSVQAVVTARLDRLAPMTRQVVQVAAVLGREFPRSLLAEVCQVEELGSALAELEEAELVIPRRRQPGLYLFPQALLQEVAYQGILLKVRRELHRRVGLLIEEKNAYQASEQVQLLAYHFKLADDAPRALRYSYEAGRHAQGRYDNLAAQGALRDALDLRQRLDGQDPAAPRREAVLLALGEVETTLGEYPEALAHLARALANPLDGKETALLQRRIGAVHERLAAYADAIAAYEAGIRALPETAQAERAGLMGAIAYAEFGQGRHAEAVERCAHALTMLAGDEHRADRAFCHSVTGLALTRLGRYTEAREHHAEALALREAVGDLAGVGSSRNNLSQVCYELGEFRDAVSHMERAIAAFRQVGDQSLLAMAENNLGTLHMEHDELAAAEACFRDAVVRCRRIGFASRQGLAHCNLGEACSRQGKHAEAIAELKAGISLLEGIGAHEMLSAAYPMWVRALLAAGEDRAAWTVLTRGLKRLGHGADGVERGIYYALAGAIYTRSGRREGAISWISRAIGLLQGTGNPIELGRAWALLAEALWQDQQLAHATSAAAKARELFEELGARYDARALDEWLRARELSASL